MGARQADILGLVLRQALTLTLTGALLGIAGAVALTRVIAHLLFQVSNTDPLAFAGITLLLLVVSLAASFIPAYRATRIDPMAAMRFL